jgi:hypothetical protein
MGRRLTATPPRGYATRLGHRRAGRAQHVEVAALWAMSGERERKREEGEAGAETGTVWSQWRRPVGVGAVMSPAAATGTYSGVRVNMSV